MAMIELLVAAVIILGLGGGAAYLLPKLVQASVEARKQEALPQAATIPLILEAAAPTEEAGSGPMNSKWTTATGDDVTVSGTNNTVSLSGSPKRILITGRSHCITMRRSLGNALVVIDASNTLVALGKLYYCRVVVRGANVTLQGDFFNKTVVELRGNNCRVEGKKDHSVVFTVAGSNVVDNTEGGYYPATATGYSAKVPPFTEDALESSPAPGATAQAPVTPAEPSDPAALRAFFLKRINKVLDAYADYCCKPEIFLSHPLLNDSSDPRTAAFVNAHGELMDAGDLEAVPTDLLRLLSEKLSDTWTAAWEASDRRGYNALEEEQAAAARQAVGAWALSQDQEADPAFRENALATFHRKVEASGLKLPKELKALTAGQA